MIHSLSVTTGRNQITMQCVHYMGKKAEKKKRLYISGKRAVVTNALGGEERKKK